MKLVLVHPLRPNSKYLFISWAVVYTSLIKITNNGISKPEYSRWKMTRWLENWPAKQKKTLVNQNDYQSDKWPRKLRRWAYLGHSMLVMLVKSWWLLDDTRHFKIITNIKVFFLTLTSSKNVYQTFSRIVPFCSRTSL